MAAAQKARRPLSRAAGLAAGLAAAAAALLLLSSCSSLSLWTRMVAEGRSVGSPAQQDSASSLEGGGRGGRQQV